MSATDRMVRVEEVDWQAVFPATRLLGAFRMAIAPAKLFVALMIVVLIWVGGHLLDLFAGARVYPGEYVQYVLSPTNGQFDQWLADQERLIEGGKALELNGIFETALRAKLDAFERLMIAATRLNFGLDQLTVRGNASLDRSTVVGAVYELAVALPGWLYHAHSGFLFFYCLLCLAVWSLGGGLLARLAGLEAAKNQPAEVGPSLRYARENWLWFALVLVGPGVVALVLGGLLAVGGLVFFNIVVTDILGGLLFGLALAVGAGISALLVLHLAGMHLYYPAMAIDGPDAFDAVSRSFHYLIGRPWRWLVYNTVALVYGAVTYLFIGMLIYLTLWVTQRFVGLGVFRELEGGMSRFDAILPPPRLGELMYDGQPADLTLPGKIAAGLVSVWRYLTIGLLAAYAVSFYFCSNTWIYLLLRRSADGAEYDEVYEEESFSMDLDRPRDDPNDQGGQGHQEKLPTEVPSAGSTINPSSQESSKETTTQAPPRKPSDETPS